MASRLSKLLGDELARLRAARAQAPGVALEPVAELTDEVVARLAAIVRTGAPRATAAAAIGLRPDLLTTWRATGREDAAAGRHDTPHARLVHALTVAAAEAKVLYWQQLQRGAATGRDEDVRAARLALAALNQRRARDYADPRGVGQDAGSAGQDGDDELVVKVVLEARAQHSDGGDNTQGDSE
jgi:hypothetical protein